MPERRIQSQCNRVSLSCITLLYARDMVAGPCEDILAACSIHVVVLALAVCKPESQVRGGLQTQQSTADYHYAWLGDHINKLLRGLGWVG